jgi:hypothetical protein
MNYIIESILVGIYVSFIYLIFSTFIKNFYLLLLVSGFFKHFLGSFFGIWTWYCNNGEACIKVLSQDHKYEANTLYLLSESIYESLAFLIVGSILTLLIKKDIYLFMIMGILLHIVSEHIGVHKSFCMRTCYKIEKY